MDIPQSDFVKDAAVRPAHHQKVSFVTAIEEMIALVILIGFGSYFLILSSRYLTMFPLIEYRQWIFHGQHDPLFNFASLGQIFDLKERLSDIAFSRYFSLWVAALFGHVCGPIPMCHDSLHLGLLLTSAILIGLGVRNMSISRSWLPAAVAFAFVILSIPVFDAISWQATLLDKLAMLLTSLTILVASALTVKDVTMKDIVIANGLLLVLMVLGYNAKEAAFFLAPAVCLLIAFRAMIGGLGPVAAIRRMLSLTLLPLAYACLHVGTVYYDRYFLQPGELSRVTGGDVAFNVEFYARYMLDLRDLAYTSREIARIAGGLFVIVLIGIVLDVMTRGRRHVPLGLWALICLAASLIIPLRTTATSPFYLLVPMTYFSFLVGLSVDAVLARLSAKTLRVGFAILCGAYLVTRSVTLQSALTQFDQMANLSRNFQDTLAEVRTASLAASFNHIVFIRPAEAPISYMYVSAPADAGDFALSPYLTPKGTSFAEMLKLEKKIKDLPPDQASVPKLADDLVVLLSPTLTIAHIERIRR